MTRLHRRPQCRLVEHQVRALRGGPRRRAAVSRTGREHRPCRRTSRPPTPSGAVVAERRWGKGELDHRGATAEILKLGRELLAGRPVLAFGHRVVHGGTEFAAPVRVDANVMAALAKLVPLAPLHQPHNLAPIEAIAAAAPDMPQIACFDTAFHRSQPPLAQEFALPRELTAAGVRRYGFHGLSYDFIVSRLGEIDPALAQSRLVIAHLGNGASLCAVARGPQRGQHHGLHRRRRPDDGHALGRARSRGAALPDAGARARRRRPSRT